MVEVMLGTNSKMVCALAVVMGMAGLGPRGADAKRHRAKKHEIKAKSVLLVSFDGRKVLFQRRANQVRAIASLSKVVASLVVVERGLKLDGVTTIELSDVKVASGGARSRLLRGMKLKNRDLLHAALMASDNRAVPALGRAVGLSPAKLVAAMNARARKMGLRHTRFKDPVGIDHGNISTAYEVAKILRQAVLKPILQKVMRKRTYTVHPVWPKRRSIHYYNTNALVHKLRYPVYGGKTGFNSEAGYCFASAMRLPGAGNVLAVVLGSTPTARRVRDFYALLERMKEKGVTRSHARVARQRRRRARRQRRRPRHERARHRPSRRKVGTGHLYADGEQ